MADQKKGSELPPADSVGDNDVFFGIQDGVTKRTAASSLESYFFPGPSRADVSTYGAVGDGVTNDLAAVQAAVNAVSNTYGGIVDFPRGNFVVTGLTVPGNVYLRGSGVGATFLSVAGATGVDGIEFTYKSTSYNWGGFGWLTVYNTGTFGNRGVFTAANANAFTKSQRWRFNDFAIRGVAGWAANLQIGDCASAAVSEFLIQGTYVAQNADVGQLADTAIVLRGAQGVVNVVMSGAYKIRGVRTGVNVTDFAEGFGLHDGEIVGSYDGVVCDSTPSKPGGFIHDNHMNCAHRCVILNRRRHITMHGNQYYRDASYIPNHALGWVGVEVLDSSDVTTGTVQTRVGLGFSDGSVAVSVTDSPDVQIAGISGGEVGTLTTALKITASAIDLSKGATLGGISAETLPTWVEFIGAVNDFKLVDNVNESGTASAAPIIFTGAGADKISIKLPKTSTAVPDYQPIANRTAAVSRDIVCRAAPPLIKESLVAGAGAYAVNYYFSTAGAVFGDIFEFKLVQIGGSNSTLNLYSGASTASPALLVTLAAAGAGTNQFRIWTLIFNGTAWEIRAELTSTK